MREGLDGIKQHPYPEREQSEQSKDALMPIQRGPVI
jgi:hypothetical protein